MDLDDPRVLPEMIRQYDRGRLTKIDVAYLVNLRFPTVGKLELFNDDDKLIACLQDRVADGDMKRLMLDLFDGALASSSPTVPYNRILRRLNRIYDLDIDEWLTKASPRAESLRSRMQAVGCDPMGLLAFTATEAEDAGARTKLIAELFPAEADRAAFAELLEAIKRLDDWIRLGDPRPDTYGPPAYHIRLKRWYSANQDRLRYDPARLMLTTSSEPATKPDIP